MYGVLMAERAASMTIVTTCRFTPAAQEFALEKSVELIDGATFLEIVGSARHVTQPLGNNSSIEQHTGSCPKCGSGLVRRTARQGANVSHQFWGCSSFPKCRYTASTHYDPNKASTD